MSHSASSNVGRKDYVPIRTALFSGGIALAVTFALITSPSASGGPPEALVTVGPVATETSTTTMVPTTTTTTTTIPETTTTIDFGQAGSAPLWPAPGSVEVEQPATTTSQVPATSSSSSTTTSVTTSTTTPGAAAVTSAAPVTNAPTTAAPATGPPAVTISRPTCANNVGAATTRTAPFTGLSASIPSNMPAVVVKVSNNNSASRASLIGIDQADIVFEERIEAAATRFFAVFHSQRPANVGPVRSGRTTDIQLTQNLNNPVFGYSGSNQGVAAQIKFAADNGILTPFINTDRASFARDGRYSAPDNLFVDPAALGGCGGGGNPTAIFSYGANNSTTAQPASSVSLSARSSYRFDWNGSAWVRSQSGSTHTTRTGELIDPKNVVVMFVPYVQSQVDSQSVDAETIGSGQAWIFRDGTATLGNWRRDRGGQPYTLTDGNGTAMNLAAGQTWVVLAPSGSATWG